MLIDKVFGFNAAILIAVSSSILIFTVIKEFLLVCSSCFLPSSVDMLSFDLRDQHGLKISSMTSQSQGPVKISPAPDWTAIFSVRYDLSPPGYDEVFLDCIDNPKKKKKELMWEASLDKKKKRGLGRNQR